MNRITTELPAFSAHISTVKPQSTDGLQKKTDSGTPRTAQGIKVSLSPEAKKKAEAATQRNADIDASHLPDGIKDSLKAIREIEQRIAEKTQELAQLSSDNSLRADQKESKSKALQIEISALRTGLSCAQSALNNAMSSQNLSADDRKLAQALIGKA